ncbi:MAG: VWA domain-containing protein [Planctomycetota bacterium]|nr:VWA domain-containing protein [Planctomycetota bacterium]
MLVSLPFHALMFAVLAGWTVPTGSIGKSDEPTEYVIALAPRTPLRNDAKASAPGSSGQPLLGSSSSGFSQSPTKSEPASPLLGNVGTDPGDLPSGLAAGGSGDGNSAGGGAGSDVRFFGAGGKGKRIGFAVDCSGSMMTAGRLRLAQEELVRSISQLPDYVSVCVVFFNDKCVPAPPPSVPGAVDIQGYSKVRSGMIAAMRMWMKSVDPHGGTRPRFAIQHLFDQDQVPDVIFMLSDGEIEDDEVEKILAINRKRGPAPIHCIRFGLQGDPGAGSLQRIANETHGSYVELVPSALSLPKSPQ